MEATAEPTEGENIFEKTLSAVERATGLDLDGNGVVGTVGGKASPAQQEAKMKATAEAMEDENIFEKTLSAVETATGLDLDGNGVVGTVGRKKMKTANEPSLLISSAHAGPWHALVIGLLVGSGAATVILHLSRGRLVAKGAPLLVA
jgi:hypothetical protein